MAKYVKNSYGSEINVSYVDVQASFINLLIDNGWTVSSRISKPSNVTVTSAEKKGIKIHLRADDIWITAGDLYITARYEDIKSIDGILHLTKADVGTHLKFNN